MFNITGEWSDAAVRRFVARVGRENVADLLALREADGRSRGDDAVTAENERIRERIRRIAESDVAFKISDLAVGGRDVIAALGIEAGPDVGEVLKDLLEVVLDDPRRNTREELLSILEKRGKKK
jgi:poly(A) polymerase/tRNA nucleotidyltransferase (CCA-adding enzyme)